jgi:5-aminopentanamidase
VRKAEYRSEAGYQVIAALNLGARPAEMQANFCLAERFIVQAKQAHPSLAWVVLPELFTCAYSSLGLVHQYAEDALAGPSAQRFVELARRLGIYVVYGFPEWRSGHAGIFDSANLVGPEGVLLTYRKRNLVKTTGENLVFVPGEDLPVVEAGGLRVALTVCWDLGFPEVAREAAIAGADLILAPAAWREPWGSQYELCCAARALDSGVYLASANQLGAYPEARYDTPGHVYRPDGLRASHPTKTASLGAVDPSFPGRWRVRFGDTLSGSRNTCPPRTILREISL